MRLDIKHSTSQKLSARVEQSVRILQMDAQTLEGYLSELMLENPVFEIQYPDYGASNPYDLFPGRRKAGASGKASSDPDARDTLEMLAAPEDHSLEAHILSQIRCTLSGQTAELACYLAGFLNDDGYLEPDFAEICRRSRYDSAELSEALACLQRLDPPGVGASSLRECLCLQLEPGDTLARAIVTDYMTDVASGSIGHIARSLRASKADVELAVARIRALHPKPGAPFFRDACTEYVRPDIIVRQDEAHRLEVMLTHTCQPVFHPNASYLEMAKASGDEALRQYLKTKIDQYQWVVRCIETRNQTLLALANVIVSHQARFFKYGPRFLNTFRMRDAAELLGLHESTVSRAVSGKWLLCEHGAFPLKYFFVRNLNQDSPSVSVLDAKQEISRLIAAENSAKPSSDQMIADSLCSRGIHISRRTVAKYRDQLGIPSAHLRVQRL